MSVTKPTPRIANPYFGGLNQETFERIPDGHLVSAYRVGDNWLVSDEAIRDLRFRISEGLKPEDCVALELSQKETRELLRSLYAPKITGTILGGTLETVK